jgi:hypothetical protein
VEYYTRIILTSHFLNKLISYESKVKNIRSIEEITDKLKYSRGWNEEDVADLDSFSEDDFYQFFKTYEGEDLYYRVKACLQFGKFDNSSERYKSASGKAEKALKRIASENKLNKLRVFNMFGITIDENV